MRILVFCAEYLPGCRGGALRAVEGVVSHLAREHEFYIFARDRSEGATSSYDGVLPGQWQKWGNAAVYHAPPRDLAPRRMAAVVRSVGADVYYANSFLSPAFGSSPVMLRWLRAIPARPMIVAPRGELHPGSLGLKRLKKIAFIELARRLPAYEGLLWQAGSREERDHIHRQFPHARIAVARDLTALTGAGAYTRPRKKRGEVSIAHLSRITPGKNLLVALRVVGQVEGDVRLSVYGPSVDGKYLRRCVQLAQELPPNVRVRFEGEVPHERVLETLSSHHVFLLPTVGESFGHAILEGLLAGCMLVISDQTPWRGLAGAGVGWDLPLADEAAFVRALQSCVDMGDEEFAAGSAAARALGAGAAASPAAIEENRALFEGLRVS